MMTLINSIIKMINIKTTTLLLLYQPITKLTITKTKIMIGIPINNHKICTMPTITIIRIMIMKMMLIFCDVNIKYTFNKK